MSRACPKSRQPRPSANCASGTEISPGPVRCGNRSGRTPLAVAGEGTGHCIRSLRDQPEKWRHQDLRREQPRPEFRRDFLRDHACETCPARNQGANRHPGPGEILGPDDRFRFQCRLGWPVRRGASPPHGVVVHRDIDDPPPTAADHAGNDGARHEEWAVDVRINDPSPDVRVRIPEPGRLDEKPFRHEAHPATGVIHQNIHRPEAGLDLLNQRRAIRPPLTLATTG